MAVVDGIDAIGRRRLGLSQELRRLEVPVELEAPHQRTVDEQLERHRILLLLHKVYAETS